MDGRKNNNAQHLVKGIRKKIPVSIYVTIQEVELLGGKQKVRKLLIKNFYEELEKISNTN